MTSMVRVSSMRAGLVHAAAALALVAGACSGGDPAPARVEEPAPIEEFEVL
ncbi:MAG: hypothetical protein WD800_00180 [Dehalococcoidia bacterium]